MEKKGRSVPCTIMDSRTTQKTMEKRSYGKDTEPDRIHGENDGRNAAQPCPGDDKDLVGAGAEGQEQSGHRRGPCNEGEEHENEKGGKKNFRFNEPFGRGEQTQKEENDHLGNARQHVEKADGVPFLRNVRIAEQDPAQIHGKVPVARPQSGKNGGHGIGDQGEGDDKDGSTLPHIKGKFLQDKLAQKAERDARDGAEPDLCAEHPHDLPAADRLGNACTCPQNGDKNHGEHIGNGVVGA